MLAMYIKANIRQSRQYPKSPVPWKAGKMYAIIGHSGSGKSTLLSLLAGLDLPTRGEIYLEDKPMSTLDRDKYRRDVASVVYQSFNLFPLLTALENVAYPMELKGTSSKAAAEKAKELIAEVGLEERICNQLPLMMSGGQQQRVAAGGKILLADEPTGNSEFVKWRTYCCFIETIGP